MANTSLIVEKVTSQTGRPRKDRFQGFTDRSALDGKLRLRQAGP